MLAASISLPSASTSEDFGGGGLMRGFN